MVQNGSSGPRDSTEVSLLTAVRVTTVGSNRSGLGLTSFQMLQAKTSLDSALQVPRRLAGLEHPGLAEEGKLLRIPG